MNKAASILILLFLLLTSCSKDDNEISYKDINLTELAHDMYIYGYPMVAAYQVLHTYALEPASSDYKGGFNEYDFSGKLLTAADRIVISPNADTPYGMATIDLRSEPCVITVPDIDINRYFSMQFVDSYTFNFKYLGKRTSANKGGTYLLYYSENKVPSDAELKSMGITESIYSETPLVQLFTRTQLYDNDDLSKVKEINSKISIKTLSQFKGGSALPLDYSNFPTPEANCLSSRSFYKILDFLLSICPVNDSEKEMREAFHRLGLNGSFNWDNLTKEQQNALDAALTSGQAELAANTTTVSTADVFGSRQEMTQRNSDLYLARAMGAYLGIYGNTIDEAMYQQYTQDSNTQTLDTKNYNYTLTFDINNLPPVNAFWSLTMYDSDRFFVDNELNRYLINSRMYDQNQLYIENNQLTIYIQRDKPTDINQQKNWLPAPDGNAIMMLRMYLPQDKAIQGTWKKPQAIQTKK